MALKSSSPINLAALRQDYSMLPRIAAVKAQANQQMIGAIQSGLEKRKQKQIEADKKAANIKVIESIRNSPLGKRVFGENAPPAKDIYASMDQEKFVDLLSTMQKADQAYIEEQRRLALLKAQQQKEAARTLDTAIERELLSRGTTETGSIFFDPDMFENTAKKYGVPRERVQGIGAIIIEKRNALGRQKIDQFSKEDPGFRDYLTALSNLPKDTTEQLNLFGGKDTADLGLSRLNPGALIADAIFRFFSGKKEFEAGPFDLESVEKYNQILKENPEILQAAGVPSQIADFIGLGRLSETGDNKKIETSFGSVEEVGAEPEKQIQNNQNISAPSVQYGYPTVPQIQSF